MSKLMGTWPCYLLDLNNQQFENSNAQSWHHVAGQNRTAKSRKKGLSTCDINSMVCHDIYFYP
jgi:hypothetical protein